MEKAQEKIRWNRKLYAGTSARRHRRAILHDLRTGKPRLETYVILLREDTAQLEMVHNSFLALEQSCRPPFQVVGIAEGRAEGLLLLKRIVEDVYRKDTKLNYAEYFADNS